MSTTGHNPERDSDTAVCRAHQCWSRWRRTSTAKRIRLVEALSHEILERSNEFAELMASEISKPVTFGRGEVQRVPEMLSAICRQYSRHTARESVPADVSLRRRPHGVVAVITPWNNPLYIPLGKIVPAVLHGNTAVWKPAPEARRVSQLVAACVDGAGWPAGLVTLVEGGGDEAYQLMRHPQVAAVTLTGSLQAGISGQEICGRRLIPFQAELGGNNAALVWHDADLSLAGRLIAAGAFEMAGQRCTANRRVIVHESRRSELLEQLRQHAAELVWGDALHPATRIGPVVTARQREQIASVVARAESSCESVILPQGAKCPDADPHAGAWFPPTILCCSDPAHEIVQQETFGPVLVVQTARGWDDAMRLCNGVRQGLSAAVFTRSRDVADRFLDQAEAGMLKVNQSTSDAAVDAPFGGWKASGIGPPEHGIFDLEFFTRPQTVYDKLRKVRSDDFR